MVTRVVKPVRRVGYKSIARPSLIIVDSDEKAKLLECVKAGKWLSSREMSVELGDSSLGEVSPSTQRD
jgi:hypothetical protein